MSELLRALRELCLFRIGPQDLPFAPSLLGAILGANVVLDAMLGVVLGAPLQSLLSSLIRLAVVIGGVWLLLRGRDLQARFVQTALALAVAMLAFNLLAAWPRLLLFPMPTDPAQFSEGQLLAALVFIGLGLWSLAVAGHILRHALERSFGMGLLLAFSLDFVASTVALLVVLPGGGA